MKNEALVHSLAIKLIVHMTFGDWLRQKIKDKDLSNAEVARRTGFSPTYIGNLVRDFYPSSKDGTGRPSEEAVEAIAKAVGAAVDEARLAAGYVPLKSVEVPRPILEAIGSSGEISENDSRLIANFIKMLNQTGKETEQ